MSGEFGSSQMGSRIPKLKRDLSATNSLARDIGGSKVPYLVGNTAKTPSGQTIAEDGERLFSPKINHRSKLLSPRSQNSTFNMLHLQATNQQHKKTQMVKIANRDAFNTANQVTVNQKSDDKLIKQFQSEFSSAIQTQLEKTDHAQIYIVDLLDELHFVSDKMLRH